MFGHDNISNQNGGSHHNGQNHHADPQRPVADDPQTINPAQPQDGQPSDNPQGAYTAPHPNAPGNGATDDLLDIKQEALHELTPLVGQLDQTPEEHFRTTMMMIQASDNHELIHTAYESAKKISSEKERAQALLDIVNEINYFTQHNQS